MSFSIFKVYQIENDDVQFNLQINLKNEKDFKCTLQFKQKIEIDGIPPVIINPIFLFETADENKVKIDFNMIHEIINVQSEIPQFISINNDEIHLNEELVTSSSIIEETTNDDAESNASTDAKENLNDDAESNASTDVQENINDDAESNSSTDVQENLNNAESNASTDVQENLNNENIILTREDELDNISEEFRDEINKKFNHNEDNENKQLVDVITNFNKHLDYIMMKLESGENFANQIKENNNKEVEEIIQQDIEPHPPQEIEPHQTEELKPHPPKDLKPHPPQDLKPHPPKELKPHPPQALKPHPPIITKEIENIPFHKKKINDVINEIQKSDLCNNVENNLIDIIIKHMTSIESYNIIGEEKKNLVLNSIESILLRNDNKNKNILLILSSKLIDTFIAFDKHKINIEDRNNYLSCFGCR